MVGALRFPRVAGSVAVIAGFLSAAVPGAAIAQDALKLAPEPIVVYRSSQFNEKTIFRYMEELGQDLQIGGNLEKLIKSEVVQSAITKHPNPVNGNMVYMVQGFIPGVESISFSEVVDADEFERLVRASGGPNAGELTGEKGKYKKVFSTSWREDVTDRAAAPPADDSPSDDSDADDDKPKQSVSIGFGIGSGSGVQVQSNRIDDNEPVIEENGRKYREHSLSVTTYLRFHDGFMFTSTYSGLLDMSLPSGDSLRGKSSQALDAEVNFYPDRIPVGFKHLFWNTMNSAASASLQQVDGEDPVDYSVRRTSGDAGLAAIETVLFDTDLLTGQLLFGTKELPVRGELTVRARKDSGFSKSLSDLASPHSRFAPLLNDNAAITLHSSVKLPSQLRKVLTSSGEWIRTRMTDLADVDLAIAGSEFEKTLAGIQEHGTFEVLAKMDWTQQSGTVIYGGMQVDDNPQLLKTVHDWLSRQVLPESMADRLAIVEKDAMPMIAIRLPDVPAESSVRLTYAYIAHSNSCLWFTLGGEEAYRILKPTLEKLNGASVRTKAPLLSIKADFGRWMSLPQDDPTGLAKILFMADSGFQQSMESRRPSVTSESVPAVVNSSESSSPDSTGDDSAEVSAPVSTDDGLLQKVLDLGGTRDASLVFDADGSGFTLKGQVGVTVVRYFVARYLKMLDAVSPAILEAAEQSK
jgi:hypothetical protein